MLGWYFGAMPKILNTVPGLLSSCANVLLENMSEDLLLLREVYFLTSLQQG